MHTCTLNERGTVSYIYDQKPTQTKKLVTEETAQVYQVLHLSAIFRQGT